MLQLITLNITLLILAATCVQGWGEDGHRIVAAIAQQLLPEEILQKTREFVGHGDFASVSTWADSVKHSVKYRWSSRLHYINTPDWQCSFYPEQDCVDDVCVSGAIANYSQRLGDGGLHPTERTEAFKFIVHFVGDIHQPLHVSFGSDYGGNKIKGTFLGKEDLNLHSLWDTHIIQNRIDSDFSGSEDSFLEYLTGRISGDLSSQVSQWNSYSARDENSWADGSAKAACQYAYSDQNGNHIEDGFDLENEYYRFAIPQIELYLIQAGVRLSALLKTVLQSTNVELPSNIV